MALLRRVESWAGARASRRLSRSLPFLGTLVAVGLAAMMIRRKGLVRGLADTGLNAIPFVGGFKNIVEMFTGDWFRDRPRPIARR
jgi:hypothetical protein